jgi:hypothetical protein
MARGSGRHRITKTTLTRAAFMKNKTYSAQYKRKFLADHDAELLKVLHLKIALFLSTWQALDAQNLLTKDDEVRRDLVIKYVSQQTAKFLYNLFNVPWTTPVYSGTNAVPYDTFDALYWQQTFGLRDQEHFDILIAAFGIDDDHVPLAQRSGAVS